MVTGDLRRGSAHRGPVRLFAVVGSALVVAGLLGACDAATTDDGEPEVDDRITLRAVDVASLTGDGAPYGVLQANGVTLAVEQLGLADDLVIELDHVDDESTPEGGEAAVREAIDAEASTILGPTLSPVAAAADPLAVEAGVPVLAVTNSTLDLTGLETVWRICKSEDQQIDTVVRHAALEVGEQRAALLVDVTDGYAEGAAGAFQRSAEAVGWAVDRIEVEGAGTAGTAMEQALEREPGVLLLAARSETAVALAWTSADFGGLRIGGNGFNAAEVIDAAAERGEGILVAASWNLEQGRSDTPDFVVSYQARFGAEPDAFAAQGYAAVQVLVAAARQAGSDDAADLQAALARLQPVETVLGLFEFDTERSPTYPAVVQRVEAASLVPVAPPLG